MTRFTSILALSLLATACATPDRAGVRNPEFFRKVAVQTEVESTRSYAEVARCFEAQAALLPLSVFVTDDAGSRITYRLRGFGYTFEEIEFAATPNGSRATVFIAPNLNAKWHEDFAKDRDAPLKACAADKA
jgi:hypothetical protein